MFSPTFGPILATKSKGKSPPKMVVCLGSGNFPKKMPQALGNYSNLSRLIHDFGGFALLVIESLAIHTMLRECKTRRVCRNCHLARNKS